MKSIRKFLSLLLILSLTAAALLSFSSCLEREQTDGAVVRVGVMAGPTGMGLAKLMNDESKKDRYEFTVYSDPSIGVADLSAANIDLLCLPTNTAANLYAKSGAEVLAINCLGSLYLVTDGTETISSLADLEGKTVYTSVPASTTGPILNYLLGLAGVHATIETVADHDTLVGRVASGAAHIAVLPEPKVTALTLQKDTVQVALNLSTEWSKLSESPLTMGCIVAREAFLKEHRESANAFLDDCKASIEYIGARENLDGAAEMIVSAGVLPKLPIAKKALNNLYGSIVYLDGNEMKSALEGFYDAIGQARPANGFYYGK